MEQINQCISCPHHSNWRECKRKCSFKYEMQRKDEVFQLKEKLNTTMNEADKTIRSYEHQRNQLLIKLKKIDAEAHWRMGDVDIHLRARLTKIQNIIKGKTTEDVKISDIETDNCPHLTGVVHGGYSECELGKACDLDCEWYELQKAIKERDYYKTIVNGCIAEGEDCGFCEIDKQFKQYKKSKQASYEAIQKRANSLELENRDLKAEIEGLKKNLLEKENCSPRYYLVTTHREWNELYKKFDYQKEQKEKYLHCLDETIENLEYIEATAERIDDDNYIPLACKIAETSRTVLREIKEVRKND